jgi:beta-ribofuranosylaminobenzene 5'-phosphate synthase
MSAPASIFVEAPARLHFGVLDLRGELGRRFGGLGAAIPHPSLLLEVAPATDLTAEGPDSSRAREFAHRFLAHHRLEAGARLIVHRQIPAHSGLGSGTQLGMAVARALAEFHGLPTDPLALARAVERGLRSAIGIWTFTLGGFIVEGGRRPGSEEIAPLIARLPIPPQWRCVVAVPPGKPGLSGEAEASAFERLPAPAAEQVERVAYLVLMQLLPALVEDDLASFGAGLSAVQRITGAWFAAEQGGTFAPGLGERLVRCLGGWGAAGVGQSSWGPAVYGVVEGDSAAAELARRAGELMGGSGLVFQGGFAQSGARVWHGEGPPFPD